MPTSLRHRPRQRKVPWGGLAVGPLLGGPATPRCQRLGTGFNVTLPIRITRVYCLQRFHPGDKRPRASSERIAGVVAFLGRLDRVTRRVRGAIRPTPRQRRR